MKVLVITGDKRFGPGNERYELQKSTVDALEVVYWGPSRLWPNIPAGAFDVVTTQDPFLRGLVGRYIARRKHAKFNVQVHTDLDAQSVWKHVLAGMVLRHADSVRVVSERIKSQVEHKVMGAKISVLPVYIDLGRFKSVVRQPHEGKRILWIGRFEQEKEPQLALKIFRELVKTIPTAHLTMLGSGTLLSELKEQNAGMSVEFPGWQDPVTYLAEADAVLSTSPAESFGASIVEALAAGVPVVARDVGVAKEAGAIVVSREKLSEAVIDVLHKGVHGELKLPILTREEWVRAWKNSLL